MSGGEVQEMKSGFNLQEILKRAVKYLIEGAAVAVAAFYIPKNQPKMEEVVMIAITICSNFCFVGYVCSKCRICCKTRYWFRYWC